MQFWYRSSCILPTKTGGVLASAAVFWRSDMCTYRLTFIGSLHCLYITLYSCTGLCKLSNKARSKAQTGTRPSAHLSMLLRSVLGALPYGWRYFGCYLLPWKTAGSSLVEHTACTLSWYPSLWAGTWLCRCPTANTLDLAQNSTPCFSPQFTSHERCIVTSQTEAQNSLIVSSTARLEWTETAAHCYIQITFPLPMSLVPPWWKWHLLLL